MVERAAADRESDLQVGDRVLVANGNSRYRGQVGRIVAGENGTGFTSSLKSAYVQFDVRETDNRWSSPPGTTPVRTLRCTSLALASDPNRRRRSSRASPVSSAGFGATTRRELLEVLCARLDALALRSEDEADRLIISFAADVVSLAGPKR